MQKFEHQDSQQFNLKISLDNDHVIPDAIRSIVIEDDLDEPHICQGMYSIHTVALKTHVRIVDILYRYEHIGPRHPLQSREYTI